MQVNTSTPLPKAFDPDFYRELYDDLRHFDDAEAEAHYEAFGRNEGRAASPASGRGGFLAQLAGIGPILEIGPFHAPAYTGANVTYFDVLTTAQLVERAKSLNLPVENVPEIAFAHPEGDLSIIPRQFNAVLSSHCIEHQPDLIRHLQSVGALLVEGGRYFVIIPDKRYCFDHFLPQTTLADVLAAHLNKHRSHTLTSVIEHQALTTHNDVERHWRGDHANADYRLAIPARVEHAVDTYFAARGGYVDVHAWKFTPQNFAEIAAQLHNLKHCPLQLERVYETTVNTNEFMAVFLKN